MQISWHHLLILLLGRLLLNATTRVIYPLLAFLASGFDVDLRTVSLLVTVQVGTQLLSPLGGTLADMRGERATMIWGLLLFCGGAVICALAATLLPFLVGYGLTGLGTALYHPANQSYASARSAYRRRGRVLGFLELSWALSALLGVSALVWLVETSNDWSPAFWWLCGVGVLTLLLTWVGLPQAPRSSAPADAPRLRRLEVLARGVVLATMLLVFCEMIGLEFLWVSYAAWLEADFGATLEQIGWLFGIIGLLELGGSLLATLFTDRLGKRRAVIVGLTAAALVQLVLPWSGGNWPLFVVLFLLLGLVMEFSIVSSVVLVSGVAPDARGTVIAMSVAARGLGRMAGSLLGPLLWENFGFLANGTAAGIFSLLGALVCWQLIREGESDSTVPAIPAGVSDAG
jgi:predicted MFS family arabinose efflux permease